MDHSNHHVSHYFDTIIIRTAAAKYGLSSEQSALILELDQVARLIVRSWFLRGMEFPEPPADLAERVSETGERVRLQAVDCAEAIATRGILTPIQVEQSKRTYWRTLSVRALLNRELAARLKLTKEQRDEIVRRIATRDHEAQEANDTLRLHGPRIFEDGGRAAREADLTIRRIAEEADETVWEVLGPFQVDKLEELLTAEVVPAHRRRPR